MGQCVMSDGMTLIADRLVYYHENDEALFFAWLDRMQVVAGYEGHGDGLHIRLARRPTDDDLRELIALHRRYAIDMRQLAALRTPRNEMWFAKPGTYWHHHVFGPGPA